MQFGMLKEHIAERLHLEMQEIACIVYRNEDIGIEGRRFKHIDVELTYNNNYPYSNLYLLVSIADSVSNIISSDTLQLLLADEYGVWKGDGWGTTYQQREEYKHSFKFPSSGNYNITIAQGMRGEPIKGIERVGVKVDRVEKER